MESTNKQIISVYSGTIRKRADGRWECYYQCGNQRKVVYAHTKMELYQKLQSVVQAQKEIVEESIAPTKQEKMLTVGEWMELWFNTFLNISKSTRQRYELDIRLHINPGIGGIALNQLTALDVQQLYNSQLKGGLSPKSIKNLHGVIHSALDAAVKMGYITKNVTEGCTLPRREKKEMQTLADDRLLTFLHEAETDEFYPAFYISLFTGLRESELLGLTWDCVDFARNTIRVYRQFRRQNFHNEKSEWKFSPLKNRKERIIVVPIQVMDMLRIVRDKQKVSQKSDHTRCCYNYNFVFTKKNGDFIQTSQLYRHFKRIVTRMGYPEVRFHEM